MQGHVAQALVTESLSSPAMPMPMSSWLGGAKNRIHIEERETDAAAPGQASGESSLRKELGPNFSVHRTKHFIVAAQNEAGTASPLGTWLSDVLEHTYRVFWKAFEGWSAMKLAPAEDLGVIAFTGHRDFWKYGQRRGVSPYLHRQHSGYYCPSSNRVVLLLGPPPATSDVQRCSVVHEVVHLLCFNCGLLRRDVKYPWWLVEGVAVSFEAAPLGECPFGTSSVLKGAVAQHLSELHSLGGLMALDGFSVLTKPPRSARGLSGWKLMYCQGWGMFYLLFRAFPDRLAAFIRGIEADAAFAPGCIGALRPGLGRRRARVCREVFWASFGEQDELQGRWLEFLSGLGRAPAASASSGGGNQAASDADDDDVDTAPITALCNGV